jgi:hypothetical protein
VSTSRGQYACSWGIPSKPLSENAGWLGAFLLQLLARLALADGIRWFEANVMNSDRKMLNLFKKLTPGLNRERRLGDVTRLVFEGSNLTPSDEGG